MKILKNRLFIAIISIALAFILIGIYTSNLQRTAKTISVAKVVGNIQKGEKITAQHIKSENVAQYGLSASVLTDKEKIINQYALADFAPGDMILSSKISPTLPSFEEKLLQLKPNVYAMSMTIKQPAYALANKLQSGDIVTVLKVKSGKVESPAELRYLEVLTAATKKGEEKQQNADVKEDLKTITFLVNQEQAELLAQIEATATMHMALAYRGNEAQAKKYLEAQEKILNK